MSIVQRRGDEHPASFGCAQGGCQACLESLLLRHERLIHFMVRRQWPGRVDYADLIQEGRIGLWQAILHYEAERGFAFSSYAGQAIRNRVWNAVKAAGKAEGWLAPEQGWEGLGEVVAAWQAEQCHQAIQAAMRGLGENLRGVIERAYGLDGQPARNLAAIGREMGVTRERVRQLRNEALGILRLPVYSLRLRSLYERDSRCAYRQARQAQDAWRRSRRVSR